MEKSFLPFYIGTAIRTNGDLPFYDRKHISIYSLKSSNPKKVYDMIKTSEGKLSFDFIDITIPYTTFFGLLDFKE